MIKLGDKVRDVVTGFEGIAIAKTEWLFGCIRFTVQPTKLDNGKILDTATFDEPQLRSIEVDSYAMGSRDTGGPIPTPKQHPDPKR
jgi:hypothetical protein